MTKDSTQSTFSSNQVAILAIVLISYLVILLDVSIVITGLPEIRADLGFSRTDLSWVQNAYTLSFGGLLMLGARAGDLLGRKRMFILGLAVFTLSSLAIGLAQNPFWLLSARAIQGMGAAILAPTTLALLSTHFREGHERTRALAYYAATAGVGASLGLVAGGIFAGWLSWRIGFFINVPICLGLLLASRHILVETEAHSGKFDLFGALSSTLGMTALVYGIVNAAAAGWGDSLTRGSVIAGLLLLAIFIQHEARTHQPILPLRLFASRERVGAYLARMLFLGAMVSFFFFSTQFMQGVLAFSPLQAGIGFLPVTIPTFLASTQVPRLTRRLGNSGVLIVALTTAAAGMLWLAQVGPDSTYLAGVALPMILVGLGNGSALGPLTISGVAGVAPEDTGAASGLVNVAHQIGGTLGLSVLVVVFAFAHTPGLDGHALLAHQLATAFAGCAAFLVLAAVVVVALNLWPARVRRDNDFQADVLPGNQAPVKQGE